MKHFTELTDFDIYRLFGKSEVTKQCDVEYINTKVFLDVEQFNTQYTWYICIENECYYGRTQEEFERFFKVILHWLRLYDKRRLIVYVDNLGIMSQWLDGHLTGIEVRDTERRREGWSTTQH